MNKLIRSLHPTTKILDASKGLCEYVASDETDDFYHEVIRASGWRFDHFSRNAPFVDSHNYETLASQVGKVIEFKVVGKQLVETVQWAIDVPENQLAQLGWKMTQGGYLKAVSVGFYPTKSTGPWDKDHAAYDAQCQELGLDPKNGPRTIYLEQQQIELSACILGANPNALARAFKCGALGDSDLEFICGRLAAAQSIPSISSSQSMPREHRAPAPGPATAAAHRQQARAKFLDAFTRALKRA